MIMARFLKSASSPSRTWAKGLDRRADRHLYNLHHAIQCDFASPIPAAHFNQMETRLCETVIW
jgi:hypothetical protein